MARVESLKFCELNVSLRRGTLSGPGVPASSNWPIGVLTLGGKIRSGGESVYSRPPNGPFGLGQNSPCRSGHPIQGRAPLSKVQSIAPHAERPGSAAAGGHGLRAGGDSGIAPDPGCKSLRCLSLDELI